MNTGIYEILNTVNGKRYVGSAVNFIQRWRQHRSHLRKGVHHSRFLQRAWDKYGEGIFEFNKLLVCAKDKNLLHLYEQLCMDAFIPEYNAFPAAGSPLGFKHPPEFGAAISARKLGVPLSDTHRASLSAARVGMRLSETHRASLAAARVGMRLSDMHRENIGKAGRGRKLSAAQCTHASVIRIGKPHPMKTQRSITFNGETHCLLEWSRKLGISYGTLIARLNRGWPVEMTLSAPLQRGVRPDRRIL